MYSAPPGQAKAKDEPALSPLSGARPDGSASSCHPRPLSRGVLRWLRCGAAGLRGCLCRLAGHRAVSLGSPTAIVAYGRRWRELRIAHTLTHVLTLTLSH